MMIGELMPVGLRGLVVAAFLAAFMSTMDTHLCWGASYLVNDIYRRFMRRGEDEIHYVRASRIAVVVLAVVAALAAWQMTSIQRAWIYVIELTAGIAFVWLLRWYWWRVNAWAEITAMAGSVVLANGGLLVALAHRLGLAPTALAESAAVFYSPPYDFVRATLIVLVCTILWVTVALLTRPDDPKVLEGFYRKVRPGGWWGPIARAAPEVVPDGSTTGRWLGFFLGTVFLYTSLLGVGYSLTGRPAAGATLVALSGLAALLLLRVGRREAGMTV
jgi:SSS family solute:Na+ symporter